VGVESWRRKATTTKKLAYYVGNISGKLLTVIIVVILGQGNCMI
jgi:hypothetical protein